MELRIECENRHFSVTLPTDATIQSLKWMLYDAIYRDYALDIPAGRQLITLGPSYPYMLHNNMRLLCLLPQHRDQLVLQLKQPLTLPVPPAYQTDDTLCLYELRPHEIEYVEQWVRGPYRTIEVDMDHIASQTILQSIRRVLPTHDVLQVLHLLSVYGTVSERDQKALRRIMNDNPRREVMVLSIHDMVTQTFL
jgi:hypothetical protein